MRIESFSLTVWRRGPLPDKAGIRGKIHFEGILRVICKNQDTYIMTKTVELFKPRRKDILKAIERELQKIIVGKVIENEFEKRN